MAESSDGYLYPGTDVLRNKADIRSQAKLNHFEYLKTARREADAPSFPMTAAGYKGLHKHLFDDVYDWAGKVRTVNITKQGSEFSRAASISDELDSRFQRLGWDRQLRDLSADRFAIGAAHHIAELNGIHPFREGNGRTMRVHLEQLGEQAGHRIDFSQMPKEAWNAASIKAHNSSLGDMSRLIQGAIEPRQHLTVDVAIERVAALRDSAIQEIQARTRQIRDLVQAGQSSTTLSKELRGLRDEAAAIGPPDSSKILNSLYQLKACGGQEVASLASPSSSARDQLHAIHNAAIRLVGRQQRGAAQSADMQAPFQGDAVQASSQALEPSSTASSAPQAKATTGDRDQPSAYWRGVASQVSAKPEQAKVIEETSSTSYKLP